jgi:predicted methyltransferase
MARHLRLVLTATVIAVGSALTLVHAQQREHVDVPRDQWQRVPDIFSELGAVAGAHIADVGAGPGYFTTRLSKAVGTTGRVYAVDVNPVSLRELRTALGTDYPNVEIIRGEEDNPQLPADTLDGALIVNAYHEFAEYRAMLGHLRAALKPGGRLVVIEPIPRTADTTRATQTKRHTIAIELVEEDLREAGFEVVKKDEAFVTRPEHMGERQSPGGGRKATDWLIVAKRSQLPSSDQR